MKTEGLSWNKWGQRGSFVKRGQCEQSVDAVMCVVTTKDVDHADIDVVVCVRAYVCVGGSNAKIDFRH